MDKSHNANFKKPRSILGRRTLRNSLTGCNDSRLEPICEATTPTPSTSRQDMTLVAEESLMLGYDSLCDETLKTPLTYKFSSHEHLRTPNYTSNLRFPTGFTDSHKKTSRFGRTELLPHKSVCQQTAKDIDKMGTPPHVLRRRLNTTKSAFSDLEEEYQNLQEFTTLEKQVLSVEGLSELQIDNAKLKFDVYGLIEESKSLKEKIVTLEKASKQAELQSENESLKTQLGVLTDENISLKNKLELVLSKNVAELEGEVELLKLQISSLSDETSSLNAKLLQTTTENEKLSKKLELSSNKITELEFMIETKETNWCSREKDLSTSLQEAWKLLGNVGIKKTTVSNIDESPINQDEKYKSIQTILDEKINILNCLQLDISNMQTSFVSKLDCKNELIASIADKTKSSCEQICNKVKIQEELLLMKNVDVEKLKSTLANVRGKAVNYISQVYEHLSDNRFSDVKGIDTLKSDLKQLLDEISANEIEAVDILDIFSMKIISLTKVLLDFKDQSSAIEKSRIDAVKEKDLRIDSISQELNEVEGRLENIVSNLKEKELEINVLQTEIKEKNNKIIELSDKLSDCTKQFDSVSHELSVKLKTLEEVSAILEEDQTKIKELHNEINVRDAKTADLSLELTTKIAYIDELSSIVRAKDDNTEELTSTLNKNKLELESLLSDVKHKEDFTESLKASLEGKDTTIGCLNNIISEKNKFIADAEETLVKSTEEIANMKNENMTLNRLINVKIKQLEELSALCREKDSKIVNLRHDLVKCLEVLDNVNSVIVTNEKSIVDYQGFVESCQNEVVRLNSRIDSLSNDLLIKDQLNETLHSKIDKLIDEEDSRMSKLYVFLNDVCKKDVTGISFENVIRSLEENFIESNDLIEHYRNRIMSKEQVFSRKIKSFEVRQNKSTLDREECEKRVKEIETSYSEILTNALKEISQIENTNKNKIESLENSIGDLKIQLQCKSSELTVKDEMLSQLNEKISIFNQERNDFYDKFASLDCVVGKDFSNISSYSDSLNYLRDRFEQCIDLLEHLRNIISSKDEKIVSLSKEIRKVIAFKSEEKESLSCLEESVILLKEKLVNEDSDRIPQDLVVDSLISIIPECNQDNLRNHSFEDIVMVLERKFSELCEIKEHFKNMTQSKQDQINVLSTKCSTVMIDLNSCSDQLSLCQSEVESLKKYQASTNDEICRLKEQASDLNNQLECTTSELNFLKATLKKLVKDNCVESPEDMVKILENKLNNLEEVKEHLKNTIESKNEQINQLRIINRSDQLITSQTQELQYNLDTVHTKDEIIVNKFEMDSLKYNVNYLQNLLKSKSDELIVVRECVVSLNTKLDNLDEMITSKMDLKDKQLLNLINQVKILKGKCTYYQTLESDLKEEMSNMTVQLTQCSQDEMKYLKSIDELNERINLLENEVTLKTSKAAIAEEKLILHMSNLCNIKNSVKSELYEALNALNDFENYRIENSMALERLMVRNAQLEESNRNLSLTTRSLIDEKNIFLTEFFNMLPMYGKPTPNITSYEHALSLMNTKLTELNDLIGHLKNVIHSKEDQLSKVREKISVMRLPKISDDLPICADSESNINIQDDNRVNAATSPLKSGKDNVQICFEKLKDITLLFNLDLQFGESDIEEILNMIKLKYFEVLKDTEHLKKDLLCNNETFVNKLAEQESEIAFLKEEYERISVEFKNYEEENPCVVVASVKEWEQLVTDLFATFSSNESDETCFSSLCIKDKIGKINSHVIQLLSKIHHLEEELKSQIESNTANMDFVQQVNSDVFSRIKSTNEMLTNLCSDVSIYKVQFDEKIALKDVEMKNLQKEVDLTLMDLKSFVEVSEKQNSDMLCLTDAFLNLQSEYESFISDCKTSIKTLEDCDNNLLNDYVEISQDLMVLVNESVNINNSKNSLFNLDERIFFEFQSLLSSYSDSFNEIVDGLHSDLFKIKDCLNQEEKLSENAIGEDCLGTISSSKTDLNYLKLDSFDFINLVQISSSEIENLIKCKDLSDLIDSISAENRMIDMVHSSICNHLIQENLMLNKSNCNRQKLSHFKNVCFDVNNHENTDMSLLMSVVDQTVLETLDASVRSVDKNDVASESFTSPRPEKTFYVLPETNMNVSDVQLENTLYLPNNAVNTFSAVDPLKAGDKTICSNHAGALWNFDNKFSGNYLDESGTEFHDAQDSALCFDPLSATINPDLNQTEGNPNNLLCDLKELLRTQNSNEADILNEVKTITESIESVKALVKEHHPDLIEERVDCIFKSILEKNSVLKKRESSLSDKYQSLFTSLCMIQKSVNQLRSIKESASLDLSQLIKYSFDNIALLSKNIEKKDVIVAEEKSNMECLIRDRKKLKESYNDCLSELNFVQATNKELEKSLEHYQSLLRESSIKYDEVLNEKNTLMTALNKAKIDTIDSKKVEKELMEQLETKSNQVIALNQERVNLQSQIASLQNITQQNENESRLLSCEKAHLLSEIDSLKNQISCANDLNHNLEKQNTNLSFLENAYNQLKTNHDDLLTRFLEIQKKVETKDDLKSLLNVDDVVEGLRNILRALEFDYDFDIKANLVSTLSKIQRRVALLKEHRNVVSVASTAQEIGDLNQKIISLESDIQDADSFKITFVKELHSLKPEFDINDLLKKKLAELHMLMISEIMTRESVIISNLKSEYDNAIASLKEELHQFDEKDKRRVEWVTEVENDNEQLNSATKKLNLEICSINERLDSKLLCEKRIVMELKNLEKRLKNEYVDNDKLSSNDIELDVVKKGEITGEILIKLQNIVKSYVPSYEATSSSVDKFKESVTTLESKCLDLQDKIDVLEQYRLDSDKQNNELKNILHEKKYLFEKEINVLSQTIKTFENDLDTERKKLQLAEEKSRQNHEQFQREKEFSLKIVEENKYNKSQLESHITQFNKINKDLNDAREMISTTIFKHEEEISSLMKVITNLEHELKFSRTSEVEKGKVESDLFHAKNEIVALKQNFSSCITDLENENKILKNDVNMKLKEISLIKEEHKQAIQILKTSLNENIDTNSILKETNENFVVKLSQLESELSEKEAFYQESITNLLREREINLEQIKNMEKFNANQNIVVCDLENKLLELDKLYKSVSVDLKCKENDYNNKMRVMECYTDELKNKINAIEQNVLTREKEHSIEVNVLIEKINESVERVNQLHQCLNDSKNIHETFIEGLLKLFPECSCSDDLLSLIKAKTEEVTSLKEELDEKTSACRYLEEDCDEMVKNVLELQKRIGDVSRTQYEDENKYKAIIKEKDALIETLQSRLSKNSNTGVNEVENKENILILKKGVIVLETKIKEAEVTITNLVEENASLKLHIAKKPAECAECKQFMERMLDFKAKLKIKELKIDELNYQITNISQKTEVLKENQSTLEEMKKKLLESEHARIRLLSQVQAEHASVPPLKDIQNPQPVDLQVGDITKLKARITKLEKDREFLKKLCDKRLTAINDLKRDLESKK